MRPATVWHALMRPPWRFLFGPWPWRTLIYLLASAAIGLLLLPVTVATLLLLPLWGIVIGALERRRTRILGFPHQTSGHVPLSRDQRHIWLAVRVNEAATWRETAAVLLDLMLGWIALAVLFVEVLCLVVFVFVGVSGSRGPMRINLFADVRIIVAQHVGEQVRVWLHSTPTLLGTFTVTAGGTVTVTLPADASAGAHRIVVQFLDGSLLGWSGLAVAELATTGADASGPFGAAIVLLLLGGLAMLVSRRRRAAE